MRRTVWYAYEMKTKICIKKKTEIYIRRSNGWKKITENKNTHIKKKKQTQWVTTVWKKLRE